MPEDQVPAPKPAGQASLQPCDENDPPRRVLVAQTSINPPKREPKAEKTVDIEVEKNDSKVEESKAVKHENWKRKAKSLTDISAPVPKKARLVEGVSIQVGSGASEMGITPASGTERAVVPPARRKADSVGKAAAISSKKGCPGRQASQVTSTETKKLDSQVPSGNATSPIYSSICSKLPVGGALGRPHLIDVEAYINSADQPVLAIADVVATILYNYSPMLLDRFLNVSNTLTFNFTRKEPVGSDSTIHRYDHQVHVSI